MRKLKFILISLLLIGVGSVNADITRTIMGRTLGDPATLKVDIDRLNDYTNTHTVSPFKTVHLFSPGNTSIEFAGYMWGEVDLVFYNGRLYTVSFSEPNYINEELNKSWTQEEDEIFTEIRKNLNLKYQKYKTSIPDCYRDGKTEVGFGKGLLNRDVLIYKDLDIQRIIDAMSDEL